MLPTGSSAQLYVEDFLGSSRVVTTSTGSVCYDADFTPFGAERAYTNSCGAANHYKFEGKERDAETQNDDFGARYYTWRFGRWLSADWSNVPAPVPYANLTNPQTLNLYAMVADDPESFADLDGHCPWCIGAVIGAVGGAAAQIVADVATHQPITLRKTLGAAVGGAIIGGTAGAASELGIAVQVAIVGDAGVIGGIAERTIKTGSLDKATENPTEIVADFATNAAGHGLVKTTEAIVTKVAGGAVENLSNQASRARTANRQLKVAGRLESATRALEVKKTVAGALVDTIRDGIARTREQKKSCNARNGSCSE
jgi:RHS repeat-associated protein